MSTSTTPAPRKMPTWQKLFTLMLILLSIPGFAQTNSYSSKYVKAKTLYVRSQPNQSATILDTLQQGETVMVKAGQNIKSGWVTIIQDDDSEAYVYGPLLTDQSIASSSVASSSGSSSRSYSTGRSYYRGPRGGCYYYSSSGKKVYVDHSYCN